MRNTAPTKIEPSDDRVSLFGFEYHGKEMIESAHLVSNSTVRDDSYNHLLFDSFFLFYIKYICSYF